ncbi:par-3 family cell polarity regulator beta a [Diretmus argenteus]
MKVTVTFGVTAVVVPCKPGWTVRDLTDQATRRYRKVLEQQYGEYAVKTHHVEYLEGGILDMDDLLTDLVEDRDKLVAVFEEVQRGKMESPGSSVSNSHSSPAPSPEPIQHYSQPLSQQPIRGEIEVNEAILKANTPLLVRSSSESALAPPLEKTATPPPDDHNNMPEVNHVLRGALDRVRTDHHPAKMSPANFSTLTKTVELSGDQGPLGIHVIPYCSSLSGRTLGLHIKGIEENSRSKRENIFQENECIVQINDTQLLDKTFAQSQEVFRQAMATSLVRLEVVPVFNKPRYEKSLIGQLFSGDGHNPFPKSPVVVRAKMDAKPEPKPDYKPDTKLEVRRPDIRSKTPEPAPVNPPAELQPGHGATDRVSPTPSAETGSSSPTPGARSQSPLARRSPAPGLATLTSKKGGKRIKIDLKKGAEGLGFTVVTRDSSAHVPGPILVKNILPRGAAVKDGRLQPGDRILEVNGVDMAGRSQEELVAMLRSTKQGESVSVLVARQEELFLPRELKGEEAGSLVLEDGREQLMYEIPLNDTGSAGLGVSLKGNKSRETGEDLGIFIKSIIHGGAAYKDGRLRANDQLIAVNGEPLLGRSNHVAMETLRRSMSSEGTARGTIQLVLLRPATLTAAANPVISTSISTTHQPGPRKGSSNQVRPADLRHQLQPPPPCRSSSLLPTLRRRASAPLPHSHRQRYAQGPGETRYTYGFDQSEGCSGYTYGVAQRDVDYGYSHGKGQYTHADVLRTDTRYGLGNAAHSHTLSSLNRHTERNLNRSRYGYEHKHTRSRTLADMHGHALLDNGDAQGPTALEPNMNGASQAPVTTNNYVYSSSATAAYPAATTNGSYGHYSDDDEEFEEDFPPPPSPGAVEEMNRDLPPTPPQHSELQKEPYMAADLYTDNTPRNRASKSMDLEPSAGGALGPTLGLWKSSSLESLQTAVSEARQSQIQAQVPFHRPRPHMVRGRGCNQSFRLAIDKSYDRPSEDDDDLSESSGRDTPASSSRQSLNTDDGKKKKKTKGKKKEKKSKGKKKEESTEDLEKKTKKKGFALLRFGKKKEDKGKEAAKASKNKLEALSEEELDRMPEDRARSGHLTPTSLPDVDVEDDDSDPNYARINTFRQPPSPQLLLSRTPSPGTPAPPPGGSNPPTAPLEELDGLYAKVNKQRAPAAAQPPPQNQHQTQADSDQRLQGLRREYQQSRAAPAYEDLENARRRVLDYDPQRIAPRGAEARPAPRFEEVERQYATYPRRDPYDYPTHSRPAPREPAPYPGNYPGTYPLHDPPASSQSGRLPLPQSGSQSQLAPVDPRYYPSSPRAGQQHRAPLRQDIPPSAPPARRGRPQYDTVGGRGDGYRQASPGRYTSPERYPLSGERYASPERYGYGDGSQPDPRQKNPLIRAV